MENIQISYGSSGSDLVAIVHLASERPLDLEHHQRSHVGSIFLNDSSVEVVGNLLEDFLLNTHKYLSTGGFVGLRARCRRLFGREADPSLTQYGDHFSTLPAQELYPGLTRIPLEGNQTAYVISDHGTMSLGAYLPHEFSCRAKELVSAV